MVNDPNVNALVGWAGSDSFSDAGVCVSSAIPVPLPSVVALSESSSRNTSSLRRVLLLVAVALESPFVRRVDIVQQCKRYLHNLLLLKRSVTQRHVCLL